MSDPHQKPDDCTRTGHFVFRVWRKDDEAWNWRLRVEAIGSGEWGLFDSLQDALWFVREHMAIDEDGEASADAHLDAAGGFGGRLSDCLGPAEFTG